MKDRINDIIGWARDRNLIDGSTPDRQLTKTLEELGETAAALSRGNMDGVKDGLGDTLVTLIIAGEQLGAPQSEEVADAVASIGCKRPAEPEHGPRYWLGHVAKHVGYAMCDYEVPSYPRRRESLYWAVVGLNHCAIACGLHLPDCLDAAWDEIKDRKGKMVDGVFIKESGEAIAKCKGDEA